MLAEQLARLKHPLVVVEKDPARLAEAEPHGHLILSGDATEEEVLLRAGVERAKTLVTALPDDADNVFITLTARNIHRGLQIIARAEHHSSQKKLIQAGADWVVLPAAIGAARIATMITRPSTMEMIELVVDRAVLDVEIDELTLPGDSPLVGMTPREAEARRKHKLLIVAVKPRDGKIVFNPRRTPGSSPATR
jgi:voltage-gated potassium channel